MDETDDPYKILGVGYDATPSDIKKAYRKLALKHHPDKQKTEEDKEKSHVIFAKIGNAYEILSDEEEKNQYDIRNGHWKGGGNMPTTRTTTASGGGKPRTTTTTTTTTTSKNPYSRRNNNDFRDPFSVFDKVFQEEFRNNDFGKAKSKGNSDYEDVDVTGGKEIGMKMATKTIDGKRVTVTERTYEMPDGSVRTKVDKDVNQSKKSKQKERTTPSSSSSNTTKNDSPRKIGVKTEIIDGMKHTTTTYPNGRSQTKIEPIQSSSSNRHPTRKATSTTAPSSSPSSKPIKTSTKISNGMKETTTTYADGRTETKIEPVSSSSPTSSSYPTTTRLKKKIPSSSYSSNPTATTTTTTTTTTTKPINSSTKTTIVDGKKHITTTYTTQMPDGTLRTSTKTKIEFVS